MPAESRHSSPDTAAARDAALITFSHQLYFCGEWRPIRAKCVRFCEMVSFKAFRLVSSSLALLVLLYSFFTPDQQLRRSLKYGEDEISFDTRSSEERPTMSWQSRLRPRHTFCRVRTSCMQSAVRTNICVYCVCLCFPFVQTCMYRNL